MQEKSNGNIWKASLFEIADHQTSSWREGWGKLLLFFLPVNYRCKRLIAFIFYEENVCVLTESVKFNWNSNSKFDFFPILFSTWFWTAKSSIKFKKTTEARHEWHAQRAYCHTPECSERLSGMET